MPGLREEIKKLEGKLVMRADVEHGWIVIGAATPPGVEPPSQIRVAIDWNGATVDAVDAGGAS